jgi:hypothetical protein
MSIVRIVDRERGRIAERFHDGQKRRQPTFYGQSSFQSTSMRRNSDVGTGLSNRGIRTRLLVAGWGDIDQRQTIFLSINNLADDDLNALSSVPPYFYGACASVVLSGVGGLNAGRQGVAGLNSLATPAVFDGQRSSHEWHTRTQSLQ